MAHDVDPVAVDSEVRLHRLEHRVEERKVSVAALAELGLPPGLDAIRVGLALVAHEAVGIHDDGVGPLAFDVHSPVDRCAAATVAVEDEHQWVAAWRRRRAPRRRRCGPARRHRSAWRACPPRSARLRDRPTAAASTSAARRSTSRRRTRPVVATPPERARSRPVGGVGSCRQIRRRVCAGRDDDMKVS